MSQSRQDVYSGQGKCVTNQNINNHRHIKKRAALLTHLSSCLGYVFNITAPKGQSLRWNADVKVVKVKQKHQKQGQQHCRLVSNLSVQKIKVVINLISNISTVQDRNTGPRSAISS